MFCLKCGTNLPEDASFCLRCGSPTDSEATRVSAKQTNTSFQQFPSKPRFTIGIVGALVIAFCTLLLGATAIVVTEWYRQQREAERPATTTKPAATAETPPRPKPTPEPTPLPTPQPTPQPRQQLVPATFKVPSGNYHATQFYVRNSGYVAGWYQVNRYDIVVAIVQEDGLRCFQSRFRNCNNPPTYYSSGGKVSSGQIDVNLEPGTYYIVFSNLHASFFDKDVRTELYLED